MIQLLDVNEQNWLYIAALDVSEHQRKFLDRPLGIVARGYAYRSCNARVIGIADDGQIIGVALVKDMDEEPACYDLQQFMIDRRFQNRGYGTEALRLILSLLSREGKYENVEVCVHKEDAAALRVYGKIGFVDTGYTDERVPYCLNLRYHFDMEPTGLLPDPSGSSDRLISLLPDPSGFSDRLISDFSAPLFQDAFKQYFKELGISVTNWTGLFQEMNGEGDNRAFLRTAKNGKLIGFIQFKPIAFTSSFFEETCGFIREFWVDGEFRGSGHGTALLSLAEKYFRENRIFTSILTTDSAADFYEKHGYKKAPGCRAKNQDPVLIKRLGE